MSDSCECDICCKLSEQRQILLDKELCRWESKLKMIQQTQNQKVIVEDDVVKNDLVKDDIVRA